MKALEILAPVGSLAIVIAVMKITYGQAFNEFFKWIDLVLTSRIL